MRGRLAAEPPIRAEIPALFAAPAVARARRLAAEEIASMGFLKRLATVILAAFATAAPGQSISPEKLRLYLEREASASPGRVEVSVGALDPRIDLSACARLEPFVPPGTRLWGRAWMGLRCTEGPSFTAYLPVQVQVHGPALVAARALASGASLGPADVRLEEVLLTREPPGALADLGAVADKVLTRPIAAGQMLRAEYFRAPPALSPGDAVRLVYAGAGFTVSMDGRAMGGAAEGQTVRVQTAAGKTLSGTARSGKIVQLGR
jgi:flagella basal body P-ring formation protein FlgA